MPPGKSVILSLAVVLLLGAGCVHPSPPAPPTTEQHDEADDTSGMRAIPISGGIRSDIGHGDPSFRRPPPGAPHAPGYVSLPLGWQDNVTVGAEAHHRPWNATITIEVGPGLDAGDSILSWSGELNESRHRWNITLIGRSEGQTFVRGFYSIDGQPWVKFDELPYQVYRPSDSS